MQLKNKNILLVIHQGIMGGAERQGLGIAKYLTNEYNCNVDVLLTFSDERTDDFNRFAKECEVRDIHFFGNPYLLCKWELSIKNVKRFVWSLKYLFKLKKGLKKYQYDVIIPFLNFPSKVSYYLYKLLPTVKFTFWHQLGLDTNSLDIFEKIAVQGVPCVIGNAENCLEMFKTTYKVQPQKLHVLPQYLSMEYKYNDKDKLKEQYGIAKDKIVIGMVAHYRPEKLHELLLNVFYELTQRFNNLQLVLLGSPNSSINTKTKYQQLQALIQEKKLTNSVTLLADVITEDVLNILDIGVLVSNIEGMPNAVMEYMLYGLPVVATNHPGCKQLLKDSPFLIKNIDSELKLKLESLIVSEGLRKKEGEKNKKLMKSYDMETYIYNLEDIINKHLLL